MLFNRLFALIYFFDDPIKLPRLDPITPEERAVRWQQAMASVEPGDLLQIFDGSSVISKLIARFDRGSWSHSASYSGGGQIYEAITSGVTIRSIDGYNKNLVRLGVYRMDGMTPEKAEKAFAFAKTQVGKGYGWLAAFSLGIERIFFYDPDKKPTVPTPNDLIVWTDGIKLVALV